MLGPVVLLLSLFAGRLRAEPDTGESTIKVGETPPGTKPRLHQLLPWFIIGFVALAAARSAGAIPQAALRPASELADWLTILSKAALGLGRSAGRRVGKGFVSTCSSRGSPDP